MAIDGLSLLENVTHMITLKDGLPRGVIYSVLALATYQRTVRLLAREEFAATGPHIPTPEQRKQLERQFPERQFPKGPTEQQVQDFLFSEYHVDYASRLQDDEWTWPAIWAFSLTAEWREDRNEAGMSFRDFRRLLPVWPDPEAANWQRVVMAKILEVHNLAGMSTDGEGAGGPQPGNDLAPAAENYPPKKKRGAPKTGRT